MKTDGVGPSVAPGHPQNVATSSATQPSLQKVKPGNWASRAGTSALTHKATDSAKKTANTLIRNAIAESKSDRGASLHTKLADAFRNATPEVREAMRQNPVYKNIVRDWASHLVNLALKGPRISIHPGDQAMRELHRVAKGCHPELAADLVVSATLVFVKYSQDIVKHNKGTGAIFGFNDKVAVPSDEASEPSADHEASMSKYEDYTYIGDLKDWIGRADSPNPRQDEAIRQLEGLVDKS